MAEFHDTVVETYDTGDYLLLDKHGTVQAVSGNSDFWDGDISTMPPVNPNGVYAIVKVMVIQKVGASGEVTRQEVYEDEW
jgi:hypothetical protein